MMHRPINRTLPLMAGREEALHGRVAQATCGNVGNAQKADIIIRIDEHFQVGEEILNFPSIEITLPTNDVITDIGVSKAHLQRPRLLIGAKKNGLILPWNVVDLPL